MNQFVLTSEIVKLSQSKNWHEAKEEWELDSLYFASDPETCLCGHAPIMEVCILKNKINSNKVTVGNSCVKKFIGLPSDKIFDSVPNVSADSKKSFHVEMIEYSYTKKWINEWEKNFYDSIYKKRKLTTKQT